MEYTPVGCDMHLASFDSELLTTKHQHQKSKDDMWVDILIAMNDNDNIPIAIYIQRNQLLSVAINSSGEWLTFSVRNLGSCLCGSPSRTCSNSSDTSST